MGQNLSSKVVVDTSKAVLNSTDRQADIILGIIWILCVYGLGAIWCAVTLIGRWSGPHGERGVNLFSVLAAFLLSTMWPLVLVYMLASPASSSSRK